VVVLSCIFRPRLLIPVMSEKQAALTGVFLLVWVKLTILDGQNIFLVTALNNDEIMIQS
jgi:hypothetical protein